MYPKWEPCPQCDDKKAKLEVARAELEVAEAKREAYVRNHCEGTLKSETRVFPGGARASRGPERAWICDGKLVGVPETAEEQILVGRIGYLTHWIKENCVDPGQPARFGAKKCVEP